MKKTTVRSLTGIAYLWQKAGKHLLISAIALLLTTMSFAQQTAADEPSSDETSQSANDSGGTTGDPDVPFDSAVPLLLAAAIAYGAKKTLDAKKQASLHYTKL